MLRDKIANGITGFGCGVQASWDGCGDCEGLEDGEKCQGALELTTQLLSLVREEIEGIDIDNPYHEDTGHYAGFNAGINVLTRVLLRALGG